PAAFGLNQPTPKTYVGHMVQPLLPRKLTRKDEKRVAEVRETVGAASTTVEPLPALHCSSAAAPPSLVQSGSGRQSRLFHDRPGSDLPSDPDADERVALQSPMSDPAP